MELVHWESTLRSEAKSQWSTRQTFLFLPGNAANCNCHLAGQPRQLDRIDNTKMPCRMRWECIRKFESGPEWSLLVARPKCKWCKVWSKPKSRTRQTHHYVGRRLPSQKTMPLLHWISSKPNSWFCQNRNLFFLSIGVSSLKTSFKS